MSDHPNVARYWRAYEAFSKGDADAIREMLADDLVWHVPGRHRFSGDRNEAETMSLFEEVVPEFSETGEPVTTTFSIEVETVVATDDWIFTRVHWNHQRDGKLFDQHGMELSDPRVVEIMTSEAPAAINELADWGCPFARTSDGGMFFTHGRWTVHADQEEAFVAAWERFAACASREGQAS